MTEEKSEQLSKKYKEAALGFLRAFGGSKEFSIRLKLTGIVEACEEGGFHVYCKEIQGVHSQGETISEAMENVKGALKAIIMYANGTR